MALKLVPINQALAREDQLAEGEKERSRQNLGQDVCELVGRRHVHKDDMPGGYLVAEPPHAHGKMSVAC